MAESYAVLVADPARVTVICPGEDEIEELMPGGKAPAIAKLSPACALVRIIVAPTMLALSTSRTEESESAIEMAGPFSTNVVEKLLPTVASVDVNAPTLSIEMLSAEPDPK